MTRTVFFTDEPHSHRYRYLPAGAVRLYDNLACSWWIRALAKQSKRHGDVTVVALDQRHCGYPLEGVIYRSYRDFVPAKRSGELEDEAFRVARAYVDSDDTLVHRLANGGVLSLLRVYYHGIAKLVMSVLETRELATAVLESESPERIFYDAGSPMLGRIVKAVASENGIRVDAYRCLPAWCERAVRRMRSGAAQRRASRRRSREDRTFQRGRRTVLLGAQGPSGFGTLFPVARKLRERGFSPVLLGVPAEQRYQQLLAEADLPQRDVADYETHRSRQRSRDARKGVTRRLKLEGLPPLRIGDSNLWDLLDRASRTQFIAQLGRITGYLESLRQVIESEQPKLVVTANDRHWLGAGLVAVCRGYDIPTLMVQDGVYGARASQQYFTSDFAAVMGESVRRMLVAHGAEENAIAVTGQPRYDEMRAIVERGRETREEVFGCLGLDRSKKLVLLATQPGEAPAHYAKLLRAVDEAVARLEDQVQLVVKLHPREKRNAVARIAEEAGLHRLCIVQAYPIVPLLFACDLLITRFSSTALEAMMFGKPVVTVNFDREPEVFPYARSGAAVNVTSAEDLPRVLEQVLNDEEFRSQLTTRRREFVQDQAALPLGKAAERVADFAEAILEASQKCRQKCENPALAKVLAD